MNRDQHTLTVPGTADTTPGHASVSEHQADGRASQHANTDIIERSARGDTPRLAASEASADVREIEAIFDAMTDVVFVFDIAGKVVRANAAARAVLSPAGFERLTTTTPQQWHESGFIRDANDAPVTPATSPLHRVLSGQAILPSDATDVRMSLPDGRVLQLNVTGMPMRDPEGHVTGAVIILRDVTEQRMRDRRTHDALDALVDMAGTLVRDVQASQQTSDAPSPPLDVAQQLVDLTRPVLGCRRVSISALDPESSVLRPIAQTGLAPEHERIWHEQGRTSRVPITAQFDASQLARLCAGEALTFDLSDPRYADAPNPYNVRTLLIAPMRVGEQLVGILALDHGEEPHDYSTDELAVAQAVARFAALVLERDRLLREHAEAQANELALREANRRMDEFLGVVSHELRNPLTSIKANIQLAERRLGTLLAKTDGAVSAEELVRGIAPVRDLLTRANRQAVLQNRLVSDLLDVSRIQSSRLELRTIHCDLAPIVRDAVREQRLAAPERTISLTITPAEQPIPVAVDSDRIGQVVTNYLTNAVKYSPAEAPIVVRVSVEEKTARVSVTDEGPGLPPEEHELIWERFHRSAHVTDLSGTGVGLGLGLHISKNLIERQGGQVGVKSAIDQGSTFWFTLPLAGEE